MSIGTCIHIHIYKGGLLFCEGRKGGRHSPQGRPCMNVCECPIKGGDTAKSTCLYGNVYALCSSGTVEPTSGAEYDRRTRATDEETDDEDDYIVVDAPAPAES